MLFDMPGESISNLSRRLRDGVSPPARWDEHDDLVARGLCRGTVHSVMLVVFAIMPLLDRVLHSGGIRSVSPRGGECRIYWHASPETGGEQVRSYVPKGRVSERNRAWVS
jgi:hypothetical protein